MAAGALGFGSGIAKGLAVGLMRQQQEQRDEARRAEDQEWKQFQMLEPIMRQQATETGDWGAYAAWIGKQNKDLASMFKKEGGSPFENLAPILAPGKKPTQGQGAATLDEGNRGILGAMGETPGEQAPIPSRPAVGTFVPEKPFWTFGGGRLDTPETKQQRSESQLQGQIAVRRRIAQAEGLTGERLKTFVLTGEVPNVQAERVFTPMAVGKAIAVGDLPPGATDPDGQPIDPILADFWQPMRTRAGDIAYMPGAAPTASAQTQNLPARLREHVERLRSTNPEWDEAMLRREATKRLDLEDEAERKAKDDAKALRESTAALLNETRRTNLELLKRGNAAALTPAQTRMANSLADDFVRDSKPYTVRLDAYQTLKAAGDGPQTPGSDLALTFAFMKMIDPGSTVREGERAIVENSTGVPDRIRNLYNSIVAGIRLTPEQRKDLLQQGAAQFVPAKARQMQIEQTYRKRAQDSGIPPENVIIQYEAPAAVQGGGTVRMRAPDGRPLQVPPADVARMKSLGAVEF
jgi:hypothetical protein